MSLDLDAIATEYWDSGVVSPVPLLSSAEASDHRRRLEDVEAELGSLHYRDKAHTALTSPLELATHPGVLDVVEALIGPDILLYNSTYIIKEPQTDSFVAWHQDLTYWGLMEDDAQVSMWLALSPATPASGCMSMIPGSHRNGRMHHEKDTSDGNLLLLGQHVTDIDPTDGVACPLRPGEASFHHGWTVHTSAPNLSDDRRIGLNVQYLAANNGHLRGHGSAMLVRGEDRHHHFATDQPADGELDNAAIVAWKELDAQMKEWFKDA